MRLLFIFILSLISFGCTLDYSLVSSVDGGSSKSPTDGELSIVPFVSSTTSSPIFFTVISKDAIVLSPSELSVVNGELLNISGSGTSYIVMVTPSGPGSVRLIAEIKEHSGINGKISALRAEGVVSYNLPPAAATLLKNINVKELGSYPRYSIGKYFTKSGSDYFFVADNGVHGEELWKTDGTPHGTILVKDIVPGAEGSYISGLVEYRGKVYFGAYIDDDKGFELWVSDGTDVGTHKVKAFDAYYPSLHIFYKTNDLMFFLAHDSLSYEARLFRSDGTESGTYPLREDLAFDSVFGVMGNRLLFVADKTGVTGRELYYTEGTEDSTQILKDINIGADNGMPSGIAVLGGLSSVGNGIILFTAFDGTSTKLWKTDGTEVGTNIYDASYGFLPKAAGLGFLRSHTGRTYFWDGFSPKVDLGAHAMMEHPAPVYVNGRAFYFALTGSGLSLFSTDGLSSLSHIDLDPTTGTASYRGNIVGSDFGVFFLVNSLVDGWQLHFHEGTAASPVKLDGGGAMSPSLDAFEKLKGIAVGDKLIFAASTDSEGEELWISDGTPGGTSILKDIFPGVSSSSPSSFFRGGEYVYFYANDGDHGEELWRTDGTSAGTVLVRNINLLPAPSGADGFTVVGSEVFFSALDGTHGVELWKTDGTTSGTVLVKDAALNSRSSWPTELKNLNGMLVYIANESSSYKSVWKSDGTEAGTAVIKPGYFMDDNAFVGGLAVIGTKAYFQGYSSVVGRELFVTDGTESGTSHLLDLVAGAGSFFGAGGQIFVNQAQSRLYFANEMSSWKPWSSDGSSNLAGSVQLGNSLDYALNFFEVGNETYFTAWDPSYSLYKTDGSEAGTIRVIGSEEDNFDDATPLSAVNSKLIFTASTSTAGKELWVSDGTTVGTFLLKDIIPGPASSEITSMSKDPLGSKTFFTVDDGVHGSELWVTDGTVLGTHLLKDINLGSKSSAPSDFVKLGAYIYFAAQTELHGRELWRTDGTAEGTVMIADILPGSESSSPEKMTPFGSKLIFNAMDATSDFEVHVFEP